MQKQTDWTLSEADATPTLQNATVPDAVLHLKQTTNARICIGRAGASYRTETLLRYWRDHAAAWDAVWATVDEDTLCRVAPFVRVQTLCADKDEYLRRPDKGRVLSNETLDMLRQTCVPAPTVQIIVADGLSAHAIDANVPDTYPVLAAGCLAEGWTLGTPIFVRYGRVAVMDHISRALNARVTVLLVGERPGLSTARSMSCYMAYEASPDKPESQRTVVSNIYANGLPPVEAGAHIAQLVGVLLREKTSGAALNLR